MDPPGVTMEQQPSKDRARRVSPEEDEAEARTSCPNLYVGNLTTDTTDKDLAALFGRYGEIESVSAYTHRNYAFIHFRHIEDAKRALGTLQGALVRGNSIKIDFAKPAKPSKHLWVGGISRNVTKEELREEFLKFGEIEDFKLIKDRNSAFVVYYKIEDAAQALKNINGKSFGGEQIRVDFVRSQPGKRDLPDHDLRMAPESTRGFAESSHGFKRHLPQGGYREGPSKVLWIQFPPSLLIDEQMLHNAMILFGEIENIKTFPGRRCAFVEFRSVDEARRAKEGLEGRLFNDARIQITYSHSEFASSRDGSPFFPGRGPRSGMFYNESFFGADMFPPGPVVGPSNFSGQAHPHNFPGPPIRGIPEFGDFWRSSPPLPSILPPVPGNRPPFGLTQVPWADFDGRDPKRSRYEGPAFIDDVPFRVRFGDGYGSPQLDRNGRPIMGPHTVGGSVKFDPHDVSCHEPFWRGLIAKGGTPVCHARCKPVGKGISSLLPEVVNCSARTGLDMLTKHYAEANGFDIVFFLPDSEQDFASYTEFLRYLGTKNRAGVAKLDDGTTLFLVPPSDFLWNVLNVTGPERLYGVVLKMPQPLVNATVQAPPPVPSSIDGRSLLHNSYIHTSQDEEQSLRPENNRIPQEEVRMICGGKPPVVHAEESLSVPLSMNKSANPVASSIEVSLTPELIATLASLVPTNVQTSTTGTVQIPVSSAIGSHSFPTPSLPDKVVPSQGWIQDNQVSIESLNQNQIAHLPQLTYQSSNQASISQFPNYVNAVNPSEIPAQIYSGTLQTPGSAVNVQHVAEFPARQMGNYTYPPQGVNYSGPSHGQQYQLNNGYASINTSYNVVQASDVGATSNQFIQQSVPSTSVPSQGWPLPQQGLVPPVIDAAMTEFPTQFQQLQAALSASTQGDAASEADKNQRYHSTLQFAANLLMQIQQKQQQGGAQFMQGPGN